MSILDICIHFGDCFTSFTGETSSNQDASHRSLTVRRHRSRRQRKYRRNVIGFSSSEPADESSDSSEDDDDVDEARPEPSFAIDLSSIWADEGPVGQLDKMGNEVNGLIRFIRRGVDTLAGAEGEAAQIFSILAFCLEDWDL